MGEVVALGTGVFKRYPRGPIVVRGVEGTYDIRVDAITHEIDGEVLVGFCGRIDGNVGQHRHCQ